MDNVHTSEVHVHHTDLVFFTQRLRKKKWPDFWVGFKVFELY